MLENNESFKCGAQYKVQKVNFNPNKFLLTYEVYPVDQDKQGDEMRTITIHPDCVQKVDTSRLNDNSDEILEDLFENILNEFTDVYAYSSSLVGL